MNSNPLQEVRPSLLIDMKKNRIRMSHINSYTRKKLNDWSAYQLFSFFYGKDTLDNLNIQSIHANDIILKPELLKG